MKKTAVKERNAQVEETAVKQHPLTKSYTLVSTKHVDYNNLTAFEAVSVSAVLLLSAMVGAAASLNLA